MKKAEKFGLFHWAVLLLLLVCFIGLFVVPINP